MDKLREFFFHLLTIYPKWKKLESKNIKVFSALGLFFPFLLVGVYFSMKTLFPKYLMLLLVALMPSCQTIDVAYSESMERSNHEILRAHIEDNLDNAEIQRIGKEKGWPYLQKLLEDLSAPERTQLKLVYEFWKKLDPKFSKSSDEIIAKIVNETYEQWSLKNDGK